MPNSAGRPCLSRGFQYPRDQGLVRRFRVFEVIDQDLQVHGDLDGHDLLDRGEFLVQQSPVGF